MSVLILSKAIGRWHELQRLVDALAPVSAKVLEAFFGGTPDPLTRQRI
ncbi:hypothetical protein LCC91_00110 [Tepidimonas taiwanensis]|nr:DUF1810 domain-containing protein [Tepidimonas taiwanensis]MCX7693209.1 hypothetical protein [Tepidimonas taiwanensis]MDM7462609.1 hypothetical protein [Tepidimonas taiwanensis]UBQ05581.1 hypothetical protein LCC91_00110 [Tepidimonas taiwanensis]